MAKPALSAVYPLPAAHTRSGSTSSTWASPSLNDPIYGSSAWGPHRGKGGEVGKSDRGAATGSGRGTSLSGKSCTCWISQDDSIAIRQQAEKIQTCEKPDVTSEPDLSRDAPQTQMPTGCTSSSTTVDEGKQSCTDSNANSSSLQESQIQSNGNQTEETDTSQKTPAVTRDSLCSECKLVRPDPTEKELIMYLHALRYKGPDFEYSTRSPDWAKEDWAEEST